MDWIRDPAWQFIGSVLAFIGIVVAFVVHYLQKNMKRLSYHTRTNISLVSLRDGVAPRITIAYDGKPVSNVRLLEITFANTGNMPITSKEFERPLILSFAGEARVLAAEISQQRPANLGAQVSQGEKSIAIAPLLLNRGDSFTVRTTVSDSNGEFKADTRIVGVAELVPTRDRTIRFEVATGVAGVLVSMGVFGFVQTVRERAALTAHGILPASVILSAFFLMAGVVMVVLDFRNEALRRRIGRTTP